MTTSIATNNLTKRYPSQSAESRSALDNYELQVEAGQLYGLVGPDGAGKTTLLRILSTVLNPTSGSAQVAGLDVTKQSEQVRSRIGYMHQAFSLYPDLSVIESLRFFADTNEVSREKQNQRINDLLEFARLTEFTSRRSEHLSGGMRKKLALACAMIHEPEVLIVDEPTTGVDPVSRRELWQLLAMVIERGVTIIVSTPYMDEAERCNVVNIIYQGRKMISGAPVDLEQQMPLKIVEVKARPRGTLRQVADSIDGVIQWRGVGDRLRLSVSNSMADQENVKASLMKLAAFPFNSITLYDDPPTKIIGP